MPNDQLKIQLLREELELLRRAAETLIQSVNKCIVILQQDEYTFENMESFDSLTSKFGRCADLYTQKVLRTIWMLLHEPFVPFIDTLNKAEKMKIIQSADQLLEIRDLRNQITHEYIPDAITELVPEVISNSKFLIENIEFTREFLKKRNWE